MGHNNPRFSQFSHGSISVSGSNMMVLEDVELTVSSYIFFQYGKRIRKGSRFADGG